MNTHYAIVDWEKHYEVDTHGKPWESGHPFRKGPLLWIRVKPRRDWNTRLRELQNLCGEQMWMVVGVFEKLCQIVGCESRSRRENGIIRNSDGEPASDEDVAWMLGLQIESWRQIAGLLCHGRVRWLAPTTANPANASPESPGIPGNPGIPGSSPESGKFPKIAEPPESPEVAPSGEVMSGQVRAEQVRTEQNRRNQAANASPEFPGIPGNPGNPGSSPESGKFPKIAEISQSPGIPLSGQVESGQVRLDQVESVQARQEQAAAPQPEPEDPAPPGRAGVLDGCSGKGPDSTRQDEWLRVNLMIQLKHMLRVFLESDSRTLANFEQWLHQEIARGRDGPALRRHVMAIARDCIHGERPIAVFLARVKEQLGYVPPSRKLAALGLSPPPAYLDRLQNA